MLFELKSPVRIFPFFFIYEMFFELVDDLHL